MLSQFLVDMMDLITGMFTELLSCNLSLFEELFGVVKNLYSNAILPMGVAILLLILVWQLFKTMFGKGGVNAEDPIELLCRSCICLFLLMFARPLANYILEVAGTPYQWVAGTEIEVKSFSEFVSALDGFSATLGMDTISISILTLIMQFVVAWNYFKMLFIIAERYVLLGVFSYTAPLAFATGGSKATNNILASWSKMFGGQIVLIIMNAWCMKIFLSGYGNLTASGYGFTKFFIATLCLIGFTKICFKMDSYMASLGINLGRPTNGMGALGLMMAVGRLLSFGRGSGNSGKMGSAETAASASNGSGAASANMSGTGPIPMSMSDGSMKEGFVSGSSTDNQEEQFAENAAENLPFDTNSSQEGVLEEMGVQGDQEENGMIGSAIDSDMMSTGQEDNVGVMAEDTYGQDNTVSNEGTGTIDSLEGAESGLGNGAEYQNGISETDTISMGEENIEGTSLDGSGTISDYPEKENALGTTDMDLEGGNIGESEMDLEGVSSGSAGSEFSNKSVSGNSSGSTEISGGILGEIGATTLSGSHGEIQGETGSQMGMNQGVHRDESLSHIEAGHAKGQEFIDHAKERTSVESGMAAGRTSFGQLETKGLSDANSQFEKKSKFPEGVVEVPRSRKDIIRGQKNTNDES